MRTSVTKEYIVSRIKDVTYTVLPDKRTTVCQLEMLNGYTINGHASCVFVENFNKDLGEKYAYENAIDNAWPLEGYLLAEQRFEQRFEQACKTA